MDIYSNFINVWTSFKAIFLSSCEQVQPSLTARREPTRSRRVRNHHREQVTQLFRSRKVCQLILIMEGMAQLTPQTSEAVAQELSSCNDNRTFSSLSRQAKWPILTPLLTTLWVKLKAKTLLKNRQLSWKIKGIKIKLIMLCISKSRSRETNLNSLKTWKTRATSSKLWLKSKIMKKTNSS